MRALCFLATILTLSGTRASAQDPDDFDGATTRPVPVLTGDALSDLQQISGPDGSQIRVVPRMLPAISPNDVRRYASWLVLSEAQQAFVLAMYGKYREAYSQAITDHLNDLALHSKDVEDTLTKQGVFSPASLEANKEFVLLVQRINARGDSAAAEFLAHLKAILADVQLAAFQRVELDRARRRTNITERLHFPARVDLAILVERMSLDAAFIEPLQPVLIEYEQRATPLVVKMEKSFAEREIPLAEAWFRLNLDEHGRALDLSSRDGRAKQQQNFGRIQEVLRQASQLQDAVHQLNREFLPKIAAALPADKSLDFLKGYSEWAYPYVYPDEGDPTVVYQGIISCDLVGAELREGLASQWNRYLAAYQKICKDMEAESDSYYSQLAATEGGSSDNAKMRKWRADRWELDARILKTIRGLLAPEILTVFERQIDIQEARITSVRESTQANRFP